MVQAGGGLKVIAVRAPRFGAADGVAVKNLCVNSRLFAVLVLASFTALRFAQTNF
jgi:hypothetical protein